MASVGATMCSPRGGLQKERKNVRECCKYLTENRLDRTQFWRRVGNVLICDMEALEQMMEKRDAGQRQQHGVAVGCGRCGSAHPPRDKRGGDRIARRQKQRANRGRSRDDCIVAHALAQSLSPFKGGSDSRNLATTSKLQILQQFAVAGAENGKPIRSEKDQAIYVGVDIPTDRLAVQKAGGDDKEENSQIDKKGQPTAVGSTQQNKALGALTMDCY